MWSYRLVWDTMFAPNPLFGVLTLATCKPRIRNSRQTIKGVWIAGWTACTLHNSAISGRGIEHRKKEDTALVYLAQVDDILPLEEYWKAFPDKRCNMTVKHDNPQWYGDNIYHIDSHGQLIQEKNNNGHDEGSIQRDYYLGKRALICRRFYYFTPDNRLTNIPPDFQPLIHGGRGESIKMGKLVEQFIEYVEKYALKMGVTNGIVGSLPFYSSESVAPSFVGSSHKFCKGGCGR